MTRRRRAVNKLKQRTRNRRGIKRFSWSWRRAPGSSTSISDNLSAHRWPPDFRVKCEFSPCSASRQLLFQKTWNMLLHNRRRHFRALKFYHLIFDTHLLQMQNKTRLFSFYRLQRSVLFQAFSSSTIWHIFVLAIGRSWHWIPDRKHWIHFFERFGLLNAAFFWLW